MEVEMLPRSWWLVMLSLSLRIISQVQMVVVQKLRRIGKGLPFKPSNTFWRGATHLFWKACKGAKLHQDQSMVVLHG
jgi:hypothetical protein